MDKSLRVLVTPTGAVYYIGWTLSNKFPPVEPVQKGFGGARAHRLGTVGGDVFVTRIGPDGKLEFSTCFGGPNPETVTDAVLTPAGELIIVGDCYGADFPTTGNAPQPKWPGGEISPFLLRLVPIAAAPATHPTTRSAKMQSN